jgi:hypothetical protein
MGSELMVFSFSKPPTTDTRVSQIQNQGEKCYTVWKIILMGIIGAAGGLPPVLVKQPIDWI